MNSPPVKRSAPGREITGAAKLRLTLSYQAFGTSQLCVWREAPGVCWFQTRNPAFARKLSQRSKARLVAYSVSRDYLRIFKESIKPWRARNLIDRYLAPTNRTFLSGARPQHTPEAGGRVETAGKSGRGRS
jgi:hypothetical protein